MNFALSMQAKKEIRNHNYINVIKTNNNYFVVYIYIDMMHKLHTFIRKK